MHLCLARGKEPNVVKSKSERRAVKGAERVDSQAQLDLGHELPHNLAIARPPRALC